MNINNNTTPVSAEIARWISEFDSTLITERALGFAKHALLDCLGCMIAGQSQPLVNMLRAEFSDDTAGECTLVATSGQSGLYTAALINGAAAHALDYDDVHFRLHGHPTACIAPAILALGEKLGASGRDVLIALVIGTEVACALGEMCEEGHYEAGFHTTGTMGTFGAAAAAARLMGLDGAATTNALGIAASQAAGLKVNFGTMTKPFHAGKAAMNGLMAARLAARGFSASDVAIEGPQGFARAQVSGFKAGPVRPGNISSFAVEEMLYKYHASCYLTHSTLNAIESLRKSNDFTLDDVESATLKIRSTHTSVCCNPRPHSGLEIKFSIQHLAAMKLDGIDTGALDTYCTQNATNPRYCKARASISLDLDDTMVRTAAVVTLRLNDGRTLVAESDAGQPDCDRKAQWKRLGVKFQALVTPVLAADRATDLIAMIENLETLNDINSLMEASR